MNTNKIHLKEGEHIVTTIRRHWFSLAVEGFVDVIIFSILAFLVIGFDAFIVLQGTEVPVSKIVPLGIFVISFVGVILWMHFFASWSDHWLDAWIITTERVIDIEQHGFFRREVSSYPLEKIQDVTYTVSGIIPTWLHFGDVRVQTASISDDLIMKQVPFPEDVKEELIGMLKQY